MNLVFRIFVPVFLLFGSSMQSLAAIELTFTRVSKEWAEKELGMRTMISPFETNQMSVRFEFAPTGKLAGFNYVRLKIYSELYETSTERGEIGRLITQSELQPALKSKEQVIVSFWIDPAYLKRTEIQVVLFNDADYHERSNPNVDGHGYFISLR